MNDMPFWRKKRRYEWEPSAPSEQPSAPSEQPPPEATGSDEGKRPVVQGAWTPVGASTARRPVQEGPIRVVTLFTPAAPLDRPDLFAGRRSQMQRLVNAIHDKGQHAVVYGERGVGKTSLARITALQLEEQGVDAVRISCDGSDDFSKLWRRMLQELAQHQLESAPGSESPARRALDALPNGDLSPSDVARAVDAASGTTECVLYFDEFDRLKDSGPAWLMADTIKMLSDVASPATLVIIGVADEASRLIAAHPSIQRALAQIHVPRMSADELRELLTKAVAGTEVEIEPRALDRLAHLSFGIPYFAHWLGLMATRSAASIDGVVTDEIVSAAVKEAAQALPEKTRVAYEHVARGGSTRVRVLMSAVLAAKDRTRFFGQEEVVAIIERLFPDERATDVEPHLAEIAGQRPEMILEHVAAARDRRWRFFNPMFGPSALILGLAKGVVAEDAAEEIMRLHEQGAISSGDVGFPSFDAAGGNSAGRSQRPTPQHRAAPPPPPPKEPARKVPPPPPPR